MGRRVQRSVRAVKARDVTAGEGGEAKSDCWVVCVGCSMRRQGVWRGEEEVVEAGHRAMVVMVLEDGSERTRGQIGQRSIYIQKHDTGTRPRAIINSTRQGTQSARRADAFRPLDKRARQQFALGLLWLRQCAHSLDAVSTGRQSRDVLKPSQAPPYHAPAGPKIDASDQGAR